MFTLSLIQRRATSLPIPRFYGIPAPPRFRLLDADLTEKFVRGSGKGGQKVNKTSNCVQLTHVPTGIAVNCQDSRSLLVNRKIARKLLETKVEFHLFAEDSKIGRATSKKAKQKANKRRRSLKKYHPGEEESGDIVLSARDEKIISDATNSLPLRGAPQ